MDARYSRMLYAIMILTSPLNRVNSALQCGTDISKSETLAKWSVFLDTVAYTVEYVLYAHDVLNAHPPFFVLILPVFL